MGLLYLYLLLVNYMLSTNIYMNSEYINELPRETVDINIHFVMTFHVNLINRPKILVQVYPVLYSAEDLKIHVQQKK